MNRIVVDPDELKRVASYVAEAAAAYSELAADLRARELPEMPAQLADAIDAGIGRVAARLEDLSARLDGSAFLVRARAAIVDGDATSRLLLTIGRDLDG